MGEEVGEEKTSGFSSRAALSAATVASAKVRFTALLNIINITVITNDHWKKKLSFACMISSAAHRRPPDPPWSATKAKSQTSG